MLIHSTVLEGVQANGPCLYIPECPELDSEVARLHWLARNGHIDHEQAAPQINRYLLAAASLSAGAPACPPRWLLLPVTDAPSTATLPDLGPILGRVLARDAPPVVLSLLLEQCIPNLRVPTRELQFRDSQPVCLNLLLALLLGTYPGVVKQPGFVARTRLYARLHAALTSAPEAQTAFCLAHEPMLMLACMEYLARVVPAFMPVHAALLTDSDACTGGFFRKIPLVCDEYRQQLEPWALAGDWPAMLAASRAIVERASRFKRCLRVRHPRGLPPPVPLGERGPAYLDAPRLFNATPDEYALLGLALGLDGRALQALHSRLRVYALPANLRQLQLDALKRSGASQRMAFLRTRRYLCVPCVLMNRRADASRCRLDTLAQALVCASCPHTPLVAVDLIGRALQIDAEHLYLCPGCLVIQPYCAGPSVWSTEGGCAHAPRPRPRPQRQTCVVCMEPGSGPGLRRVDHLTGEMHWFAYCQRHAVRTSEADACANVRQLAAYHAVFHASCAGKARHLRRHRARATP